MNFSGASSSRMAWIKQYCMGYCCCCCFYYCRLSVSNYSELFQVEHGTIMSINTPFIGTSFFLSLQCIPVCSLARFFDNRLSVVCMYMSHHSAHP